MSLKIDRVQLDIIINNDQARIQMRKLEEDARLLTKEMGKLDKTSQEYTDKAKKLFFVKQEMDKLYESIGIANLSMKELITRQKDLNMVLLHMRPGTQEYASLKTEVDGVSARISELKSKTQDTDFSLGKMADGANRYFALITAAAATLTGMLLGSTMFKSFCLVISSFMERLAMPIDS